MFISPEVIRNESYDHRVDIWALGCVIYYWAALEPPFIGENKEALLRNILFKNPKLIKSSCSVKLKDFIFKLLEKQKSKRPIITEIQKAYSN